METLPTRRSSSALSDSPLARLICAVALWTAVSLPSVVFPFSALAERVGELEPNDTNATTNTLLPGQFGEGRILAGPEFDGWIVPNVRTDDTLCIFLNGLESPAGSADPIVTAYFNASIDSTSNADLYNDDGGPLAEGFRDSLICGDKVKRAGSMFIRTDGFGSSTMDPYHLYQTVISPNQVLPETESNDSPSSAMPINSPAILASLGNDPDYYSFHAEAGERIVVMVDQDPGRPDPASQVSTKITIFDSDGVTDISESLPGEHLVDTNTSLAPARAYGALPAPHAGTYFVRITKAVADGPESVDGDYRLVVLVDGDAPLAGACFALTSCTERTASNCRGKFGGQGTTCTGDVDADGLPDAVDNCSSAPNDKQEDFDADDIGDICDGCSSDPLKMVPGACGCGFKDTDSDADGTADCNDQCPADVREVVPGACGCGVVEADANKNGVFDCLAGADVKNLLQRLVVKLKAIKGTNQPSKGQAKNILALSAQIASAVKIGGTAIVTTKAGVNLSKEASKLGKALQATLKSSGAGLATNKAAALKNANRLIGLIA